MQKWITRILLIGLVVYGGYRAVGWLESTEAERYRQKDEMVRQVAEKNAGQVQRSVQHGTTIRTNALREQLQEAAQGRDSLALP